MDWHDAQSHFGVTVCFGFGRKRSTHYFGIPVSARNFDINVRSKIGCGGQVKSDKECEYKYKYDPNIN